MSESKHFFRELEGIRGFAFLAVFFAHYVWANKGLNSLRLPRIVDAGMDLAYITVPMFFILSGFLITRVLFTSRDRPGYFRNFYARRFVRILPLYYLTWAVLGALRLCGGAAVPFYMRNLLFVGNWSAGSLSPVLWHDQTIWIGHFWSLCMEEQFYLLWPLTVWICRSERAFKTVCFVLIGVATAFRCAWPFLHKAAADAYFHTLTRFDALILGALMAIYFGSAAYRRLERCALPGAALGGALLVGAGYVAGSNEIQAATTFWREMCLVPLINVVALLLVVAVMREGSRLQAACQGVTITRLGAMTYGAYIFHFLYADFFAGTVCGRLSQWMTPWCAAVVSTGLAFGLTMVLALAAYEWIEKPCLRLKSRIHFGSSATAGEPRRRAAVQVSAAGEMGRILPLASAAEASKQMLPA